MEKLISILLVLIILISCFCFANSCGTHDRPEDTENNGQTSNESEESQSQSENTDDEFDITSPSVKDVAIIHMIKEIEDLPDWQAGKTEFNAIYYVDDITAILDSLDWKHGDITNLANDFDFKIDLYRKRSELGTFDSFFAENEEQTIISDIPDESDTDDTSDSTEEDTENTDRKISVQYLISYKDKVVNMRFSDKSIQSFDVFAEIGEAEMKMIVLCLKYYFGPTK